MGTIQKKNTDDFFMMVLPETRRKLPLFIDPQDASPWVWGVSVLKCGQCSPKQRLKWTAWHSQWLSRWLVHLTFYSHSTLSSLLMCFLPDWQQRQPTSQAYTLWPQQRKLGPCPPRNTWPRGSPSTNTDDNQYPKAPDYSNSTGSAVDGLHGWDLLLLFRLYTHIFMCPLHFIVGKINQHRANDIPIWYSEELKWVDLPALKNQAKCCRYT